MCFSANEHYAQNENVSAQNKLHDAFESEVFNVNDFNQSLFKN